jgi:hypothetical protein
MWYDEHAPAADGSAWATYIVLGRTGTGGEAVWVMRQSTTSAALLLVDPRTGRSYLRDDVSCPLRAIGTVASAANVWANTQLYTVPDKMSWNLGDVKAWRPLFSPAEPRPPALGTVQSVPIYRVPDVDMGGALERDLLGSLANQLRAWRPRYTTRIRNDVSAVLRPLLLELEARAAGARGDALFPTSDGLVRVAPGAVVDAPQVNLDGVGPAWTAGRDALPAGYRYIELPSAASRARALAEQGTVAGVARNLEAEHQRAIDGAAHGYVAHGFPLQMTFTSLENVLRRVKLTRVHAIEDEAAQFAVAALVVPYPNDIFAVWVYIVTLVRREVEPAAA